MKKRFDVPTTFIITGIIQMVFLVLYAIVLFLIFFIPILKNMYSEFIYIHFQFAMTLALVPVMPICLIWNSVALIYARDENGKGEKEGRKWLYIILSALFMLVAWVAYIGVWITFT